MPPVRLKNTGYGRHRLDPAPKEPEPTITVADRKTEPPPEPPIEPDTLAPELPEVE
jgi:hypothetical protein